MTAPLQQAKARRRLILIFIAFVIFGGALIGVLTYGVSRLVRRNFGSSSSSPSPSPSQAPR